MSQLDVDGRKIEITGITIEHVGLLEGSAEAAAAAHRERLPERFANVRDRTVIVNPISDVLPEWFWLVWCQSEGLRSGEISILQICFYTRDLTGSFLDHIRETLTLIPWTEFAESGEP